MSTPRDPWIEMYAVALVVELHCPVVGCSHVFEYNGAKEWPVSGLPVEGGSLRCPNGHKSRFLRKNGALLAGATMGTPSVKELMFG